MKAHTVQWLVFLALIKNFSCYSPVPFKLEDTHLTAKEGSCIEIKCRVTYQIDADGAYWFWMKNGIWNERNRRYSATIIYSTNTHVRPVSPDFADRVKYIGSPSSSWQLGHSAKPQCGILICGLKKTDNGNYSFRFIGKSNWVTQQGVNLIVADNPCLITFEKPPVVQESGTITLTCSTLSSCPSKPQIEGLTQPSPTQLQESENSVTVSFNVTWKDHGKEFSCQTQDNNDAYLIRNISVTVEYAPKDTVAKMSPVVKDLVKEGQSVTLTCSARGHPEPTFTWLANKQEHSGAEWNFPSIERSQSGKYYCNATNRYGTIQSNPVLIDVTYLPQVEVMMTPSASEVKQGDKIILTCNVKRSNPQPRAFTWQKNGIIIRGWGLTYVVQSIRPEDSGAYSCQARNTLGFGSSEPRQIVVNYRPRNTRIFINRSDTKVKVGDSLTFTCATDANPAQCSYFWYRYNSTTQINTSQWKSELLKTTENSLSFHSVQRADEACYRCKATNKINAGENSEPLCIQVLYAPTKPTLSMDTEVREGQLITISCAVESAPASSLTLTRTSSKSSERLFPSPNNKGHNTLQHTFNVTYTHAGFYTCNAVNSVGSNKSVQRKLVVKYCPKEVTVQARPGLVVNENMLLTLQCSTQSYPAVTSVTWMKIIDGRSEIIQKGSPQSFTVTSVSPSDSGLYSCAVNNEIGTGNSQRAEVKVKYAPKYPNITRAAEQQESDGRTSVRLSCSSQSYPPAVYSWYKMTKVEEEDVNVKVSDYQNFTVYSNKPGVYYCIAKNEINQRSSEPVHLFADGGIMMVLMLLPFLIILLVIIVIFFVYRHKRNKRGTTPHFGIVRQWSGARRMNEPIMGEPFRSRDDLLTEQPCRPNAQRHQPPPDSTPASHINTVYCTVNLTPGNQGPSAQKPITKQGGHTEDDSLNYASIHFENKQTNKQAQAEQDVVYSTVCKKQPPDQNEQRRLQDYENVSAEHATKYPNPLDDDTDTSEDEAELNYPWVTFKAKPGHRRASTDSSTSDEAETQYSQVKI